MLRRLSVQRISMAHLGVIVPASKTARFKEMSQRWGVVGNTVSDLIGPRFESQTSHSRAERVTARVTGSGYVFYNLIRLPGSHNISLPDQNERILFDFTNAYAGFFFYFVPVFFLLKLFVRSSDRHASVAISEIGSVAVVVTEMNNTNLKANYDRDSFKVYS